MNKITVLDVDSAPDKSKAVLEGAQKKMGFVPNLFGVLSHSPATLKAYMDLSAHFSHSSFDPTEQQVVLLTVSYLNNCHYCMAAHSTLAAGAGVDGDIVQALRDGTTLPDPKLDALHRFTKAMVNKRGFPEDDDLDQFLSAGYKQEQALEVILGIAMKTISNYTNHIAETPLDAAFQDKAWEK